MAVWHRAWQFDIARATAAFGGISGSEDLFGDRVTSLAEQVRADPSRLPHLVMLRLDPTDDEAWEQIMSGVPTDEWVESAAGTRLMLVLVSVCSPAPHLGIGTGYLEGLLMAVGWPRSRAELAVHGARLRTFFEEHVPTMRDIAERGQLTGGWLDASTAAALRTDLERDLRSTVDAIPRFAAEQSSLSGVGAEWLDEHLRAGVTDLDQMLAQPTAGSGLWIIID